MKPFLLTTGRSERRGGFSLVETTFSLGLFSSAFLILMPLLALGLKTSRLARDDRESAQIARTLVEEVQQGTLQPGTLFLDGQGNACPAAQAAYSASTKTATLTPMLQQWTVQVTPLGAPNRARTYAVLVPGAGS